MNIFIFNPSTFEVEFDPYITSLKPFEKIINRDKSNTKERAKAELSYIYFMWDYKSDFQSIMEEEDRRKEIITVLSGLPPNWKEDKIVQEAVAFYKKRSETIASTVLEDQRNNIKLLSGSIKKFVESTDSNDVARAASISEKLPKLIESIDKLEKMVKGQRETSANHRGSQEKSMFEDGV